MMRRLFPNILSIAAGFTLALLLTGAAGLIPGTLRAQSGAGQTLPPYDPAKVETLSGLVVAALPVAGGGVPFFVHFTLSVKGETLTVLLAPNWYLAGQGFAVKPLDQVTVKGSRAMVEGKPALIAGEVQKDGTVLRLRDEKGAPLWGRQGRP